ncbi:alpha/beta hydrolase [Mesorhizobium sp.]|uniref:alpha/beta hydrolase n=1 Tax=Mesorhizobium sp. TaxID=1871066 RepID=UPI000FE2D77E|nr:alpha/beta hydrolase [Mesorhizobium sp.]RWH72596.1 MAG: alpha/beta hydrolase [Mesorhizobium sp.]RWL34518.1 MAG: alpha/beta hydrolase [Mesorhizobium sp.]RWL35932.1 MAG: alpha/beta hydrolase [Mesorhizobium sp.]RWL41343.1 MAG: alpha/beta hydrolase [Mesorhizobium sp.]RWL59297.1 MAG: alpha/beta hydrolase [Mesorhizobium sp.]
MLSPLDPQARKVLELGRLGSEPPFEAGTPEQARRAYKNGFPGLQGEREPVASEREQTIVGPGGPLSLRVYRGQGAPTANAPALLYLHGGGWVIGNLDSHDEICRWYANIAACVVVSPDYRLAPEHKFPAAVGDCRAVLSFMQDMAGGLGIDASRIAVAGDSAGGNLAAVLALLARDDKCPPTAQLLFYPNTDAAQTADSYRRFGEGFGLTARTMAWFREHYVRSAADRSDWRVSPLKAKSLAGAAPAFVTIAGHDILADEGEAYARRLKMDGVPVVVKHWPGQIHGFVSMGRHGPASRQAVEAAVAAWRNFDPAFGRV